MSERPAAVLSEEEVDFRLWQAPEVSTAEDVGAEAGSAPPTAAQLAEIEAQARAEGYREGLEQGRRQGEQEMREKAEALERIADSLAPQGTVLDDALVAQLGDLVMAIARQLVRRELGREPGEVVRVVREALSVLPVSDAQVRVFLSPADVALVRETLKPESLERSVRLLEDVTLERGGARVETDVSSVDASVEARLSAIAARLFGDERSPPADAAGEAEQ